MSDRRNAWAHGRCVARQRQLQAQIDAALAKLDASDDSTSWEAMHDLVVEARNILRGRSDGEPSGKAVPVEELRRAAPPSNQPPAPFTTADKAFPEEKP